MMILGGAVIPPLQGSLGDTPSVGMHNSYIVAAVWSVGNACIKIKGVLKSKVDFDSRISGGH